jgi:predicted Zn-dependent peptidase
MACQTEHFPSGLTLVTDERSGPEIDYISVAIRGGSSAEAESAHGVAHLFEHVAFSVTSDQSRERRWTADLDAIAAHPVAHTGKEQITFGARVRHPDLGRALRGLGAMVRATEPDEHTLRRERRAIQNEIGAPAPLSEASDRIEAQVFAGTTLARSAGGTASSVDQLTSETLAEYSRKVVRPDRIVIGVAGVASSGDVRRIIEETWAGWLEAASQIQLGMVPSIRPEYADSTGVADGSPELPTVVAFRAPPATSDGNAAIRVLDAYLSGGMSSPVVRSLRDRLGIAYSSGSWYSGYERDGVLALFAFTRPEDRAPARTALLSELRRVADGGLDRQHLADIRSQLEAGTLLADETTERRARRLTATHLLYGEAITAEQTAERLGAVTGDELIALSKQMLETTPAEIA